MRTDGEVTKGRSDERYYYLLGGDTVDREIKEKETNDKPTPPLSVQSNQQKQKQKQKEKGKLSPRANPQPA